MKKKVEIEINKEKIHIGWESMMFPTKKGTVNTVWRMLQLNSLKKNQEGDIFFFQYRMSYKGIEEWCLVDEHVYINLEGPEELVDMYLQDINRNACITWDDLIEKIFRCAYWKD